MIQECLLHIALICENEEWKLKKKQNMDSLWWTGIKKNCHKTVQQTYFIYHSNSIQ